MSGKGQEARRGVGEGSPLGTGPKSEVELWTCWICFPAARGARQPVLPCSLLSACHVSREKAPRHPDRCESRGATEGYAWALVSAAARLYSGGPDIHSSH